MFAYSLSQDLSLALLEPRHAEELFRLTEANREHLREWLPWVDGVHAVEDTRAFIRITQKQWYENNGFQTAVQLRSQIVGVIGCHRIDRANRSTSLGYWLAKAHEGRGVMTTACRAYVDHLFGALELNRVEIRCAVENWKSRRIPERLGFREEGTVRDAEWLYDHFVDHVMYGMVVHEWRTGT
jgi:ribosomal-protein-serine acetyltransferase